MKLWMPRELDGPDPNGDPNEARRASSVCMGCGDWWYQSLMEMDDGSLRVPWSDVTRYVGSTCVRCRTEMPRPTYDTIAGRVLAIGRRRVSAGWKRFENQWRLRRVNVRDGVVRVVRIKHGRLG